MKLAAKQAEVDKCPHVSDEARETLAESAALPTVFDMRGQTVGTQINVDGDYVDRRATVIVGDGNVVGHRSSSRVIKTGSSVSDGGAESRAAGDVASLRRQLAEARANLRLIEERTAEYVLSTDVPLQLVKEKRRLQQRIADPEARLEEVGASMTTN